MYTVMRAARIKSGSLASDAWNAWAVPWKLARCDGGGPMSRSVARMARTAWPSDTPGARLNDSVTAENCPWWLMARGVALAVERVKALSGTCAPVADLT